MKTTLQLASLALLSLLFTNCIGYTLGPAKPAEFDSIKTIAVPTFKNNTLEPRVAVMATNALIKEMQRDGTYKIVDTSEADAIFVGTIGNVKRARARTTRSQIAGAKELASIINVAYVLKATGGERILTFGSAVGKTNFVLDQNQQLSERQAFAEVLKRVAIEINSEISEGW